MELDEEELQELGLTKSVKAKNERIGVVPSLALNG
jgi:hypothetical protein